MKDIMRVFIEAMRRFFYLFTRKIKHPITEEEIQAIIDESEEEGVIDEEEHEMIEKVLKFKNIIVKNVMTPRIDINALPDTASLKDTINLIIQKGHSRIPIYNKRLDNIIGIVYAKDLLKFWGKESLEFSEVMREPFFIPETKTVEDLLKEFRKKRIHIAIVIDEYGGTAGLVTIEDLIEEIIGEIEDEYDKIKSDEFVELKDGYYLINAQLEIEKLEEFFDIDVPKEDYETVGGLIFHLLGRIPKPGEKIFFKGLNMIIEKATERRIELIKVKKVSTENIEK
ncbi:MAG: HlyC/CorC family transporter [Deltaproteobacteria bacterium]|nr:MAG: HlyC/CorC family transporter [Deltaproteobacteria bacterium]